MVTGRHFKRKRKLTLLSVILLSIVCVCLLAGVAGITITAIKKSQEKKQLAIATLAQQKADKLIFNQQSEQQLHLKKLQLSYQSQQVFLLTEKKAEEERKKAQEQARQEYERKKAEEERARLEAARRLAAQKEAQRAAEEKARLAAERTERVRLSSIIKQQALRLEAEQAEYYALMPEAIVNLSVDNIMQNPELPNGCEITSLAIVLNYLGHYIDKGTLSDSYLPQTEFRDVNKVRVGGDPNLVYCGNPRYKIGGYYCFAQPIVNAGNAFLRSVESPYTAYDITGSSEADILAQLDSGNPVIAITTLSMGDPVVFEPSKWIIDGTNSTHIPYINLHCIVLYGYDNDFIYIADPMKGKIQCKRASFFDSYAKMGSRAVIVA